MCPKTVDISTVLGHISANTSSAHPSTADEAWYWPNASCALGDFT